MGSAKILRSEHSNIFSRICETSTSYRPNSNVMKKVAFMIGEDLEEDEIGEDAFHHDFGMQLQAADSDYSDDFGVYSYDTQESLESVKSCLADRLETKVS